MHTAPNTSLRGGVWRAGAMRKLTFFVVLAGTAASLFFFLGTLHAALYGAGEESEPSALLPAVGTQPAWQSRASALSKPSRLLVPALGIDAAVQEVGLAKSGAIAAPQGFTDAGWYRGGPAPGEEGVAVMDGHLDNGLGLPGVFKNLARIERGDAVSVVGGDGAETLFEVIGSYELSYKDTIEDVPGSALPGAYLYLVTCEGKWVSHDRTYSTRRVVVARLVSGP